MIRRTYQRSTPESGSDLREQTHRVAHGRWLLLAAGAVVLQAVALVMVQSMNRSTRLPPQSGDGDVLQIRWREHPLDYANYLALAMNRMQAGDIAGAERHVRAALVLAPREPQSLRTAAFTAFAAGDPARGIDAIVKLVETDPDSHNDGYTALAHALAEPALQRRVTAWVEARSPHLGRLADAACRADIPVPSRLWIATRAGAAERLEDSAITCLFALTARSPEVASVFALWLGLRPELRDEVPHLPNGGFEGRHGTSPFDWRFGRGGEFRDGYSVSVQQERAHGSVNRYLSVELNGRPVQSTIAETNTVLAAGRYRLGYRVRDWTAGKESRFGISVSCHGGTMIASVQPAQRDADAHGWRTVQVEFDVARTCHAQSIRFDGSSPAWRSGGTKGRVDVDDIVITRAS